MEAYLDNSATTRCSQAATDKMVELLTKEYGNPSSLHLKGVDAENEIKDARKKIIIEIFWKPEEKFLKKVFLGNI